MTDDCYQVFLLGSIHIYLLFPKVVWLMSEARIASWRFASDRNYWHFSHLTGRGEQRWHQCSPSACQVFCWDSNTTVRKSLPSVTVRNPQYTNCQRIWISAVVAIDLWVILRRQDATTKATWSKSHDTLVNVPRRGSTSANLVVALWCLPWGEIQIWFFPASFFPDRESRTPFRKKCYVRPNMSDFFISKSLYWRIAQFGRAHDC